MDLRQLRHFVTLAHTLNYRQAAELLHISQPPLSLSIRKLEEDLGVQLFERDRRGTHLSVAGMAALEDAKQALHYASQVQSVSIASRQGERGRLHIGFVGSATFSLIPRLVPALRERYPEIELVLTESTSRNICAHVASGEFDAGLVRYPLSQATQLDIVPIESDVFVAALPHDNHLAGKKRLKLADLAGEDFVNYHAQDVPGMHALVVLACQNAGFMPRTKQHAIQVQTLVSLVGAGLGVALVPKAVTRTSTPNVVFRDLHDLHISPPIGFALTLRAQGTHPTTLTLRRVLESLHAT